jgi:hypothetical protein
MKMFEKMMLVVLAVAAMVFVGNANASMLFGVSFDESVNAEVAGGDGTGYKYFDPANFNLASRTITTDEAKFGAASLDAVTAGTLLAYHSLDNINLTKGTLDLFLYLNPEEGLTANSARYVFDIGGYYGLRLNLTRKTDGTVFLSGKASDKYFDNTPGYGFAYVNTGQWLNIAYTWDMSGGTDAGTASVFLDGVLLKTLTGLDPFSFDYATMKGIGSFYTNGNGAPNGYIDDFVIYDEVMYTDDYTVRTASAVPEPATMALLGLGGLLFVRRRKN